MKRRRSARWQLAAVAVAAVVSVAFGANAVAGHLTSGVKSYTGCLTTNGGTLTLIKEGNSPHRACPSGSVEAHFSGGDITSIVAGTGVQVTNGTNGAATIALDPQYGLRQDCAPGQVVKWNGSAWACAADNDTTYSAGTGLAQSGTQFSIASDYRVKNTPDCSAGQFATGFDSSGGIQCGSPSATVAALSADQEDYGTGKGIADSDAYQPFGSLSPAAGTYFVVAKGAIYSEGNVDQFRGARCAIRSGGTTVDSIFLIDDVLDSEGTYPFALNAVVSHASGALELACLANEGADGLELYSGRITALKVG